MLPESAAPDDPIMQGGYSAVIRTATLFRPMPRRFITLLALACTLPVYAEELRVALPGHDDLVIDLPKQWHAQVQRPRADLPPSVAISAPDNRLRQRVLTPIWPAKGAQATPSSEPRAPTQAAATQAKPKAVESELPLKSPGASSKVGYYFSATNRAGDADGFKHLTLGVLAMNELQVNFTVLANGDTEEPTDLALETLRSMRRAPAGGYAGA